MNRRTLLKLGTVSSGVAHFKLFGASASSTTGPRQAGMPSSAVSAGKSRGHKYDNFKAFSYARAWCAKEQNSCGVFLKGDNKSDCAHFIAHCLNAGGIRVANKDAATKFCGDGLAVRNSVIVDELKKLASLYSNIKEMDLVDGVVGDVGFLDRPDRPYHAFMVCEPYKLGDLAALTTGPKVWAHSLARCCEPMDTNWKHWFSSMFRLEDG
ncbi:MAG TPA: amidase domain-containing protein [Lysobacter sp.]|jgi:hypothetical protein|nr:amidase domain-containing protein [Lysobacter sp.]